MNAFAIKLENDRIFREGSFPEMRSEVCRAWEPDPRSRDRQRFVFRNIPCKRTPFQQCCNIRTSAYVR